MIWVMGVDDDARLGVNPTPKTKAVFTIEHLTLGASLHKNGGYV